MRLPRGIAIAVDAFRRFNDDDGWAVGSHIALSVLMAMFPFLLVVTALASIFGEETLANESARLLLEAWPREVADPIAIDIEGVLASAKGNVLTVGAVLSIFFASSGVESLRVGLNRAYDISESRPWWQLRLESIVYVLIGAVALLVFAVMVVLAPLLWDNLARAVPDLRPFGWLIAFVRYAVAATILVMALVIVHLWLPAGRRRLRDVLPGIGATLVLWLAAGEIFGHYLATYAFTYAIYYAGLASAMIALVFLYLVALIFVYGGELNTAIAEARREARAEPATLG